MPSPIGQAEILVVAQTKGFQADTQKKVDAALKGVQAPVEIGDKDQDKKLKRTAVALGATATAATAVTLAYKKLSDRSGDATKSVSKVTAAADVATKGFKASAFEGAGFLGMLGALGPAGQAASGPLFALGTVANKTLTTLGKFTSLTGLAAQFGIFGANAQKAAVGAFAFSTASTLLTKAATGIPKIFGLGAESALSFFGATTKAASVTGVLGAALNKLVIPLAVLNVGVRVFKTYLSIVDALQRKFTAAAAAAGELEQQVNAANVTFGKSTKIVEQFATTTAAALGLSETEALAVTNQFGNLFIELGAGQEAAAGLSTSVVELAGDLALLRGLDLDTVTNAFLSGILGNERALKRLGIVITEFEARQAAVKAGFEKTAASVTQEELVYGRLLVLTKKLNTAQSDQARTATTLALKQAQLSAAQKNAATTVSTAFLPLAKAFTDLETRAFEFVASLRPVFEGFAKATDAALSLSSALFHVGGSLLDLIHGDLQGALGNFLGIFDALGVSTENAAEKTAKANEKIRASVKKAVDEAKRAEATYGGLGEVLDRNAQKFFDTARVAIIVSQSQIAVRTSTLSLLDAQSRLKEVEEGINVTRKEEGDGITSLLERQVRLQQVYLDTANAALQEKLAHLALTSTIHDLALAHKEEEEAARLAEGAQHGFAESSHEEGRVIGELTQARRDEANAAREEALARLSVIASTRQEDRALRSLKEAREILDAVTNRSIGTTKAAADAIVGLVGDEQSLLQVRRALLDIDRTIEIKERVKEFRQRALAAAVAKYGDASIQAERARKRLSKADLDAQIASKEKEKQLAQVTSGERNAADVARRAAEQVQDAGDASDRANIAHAAAEQGVKEAVDRHAQSVLDLTGIEKGFAANSKPVLEALSRLDAAHVDVAKSTTAAEQAHRQLVIAEDAATISAVHLEEALGHLKDPRKLVEATNAVKSAFNDQATALISAALAAIQYRDAIAKATGQDIDKDFLGLKVVLGEIDHLIAVTAPGSPALADLKAFRKTVETSLNAKDSPFAKSPAGDNNKSFLEKTLSGAATAGKKLLPLIAFGGPLGLAAGATGAVAGAVGGAISFLINGKEPSDTNPVPTKVVNAKAKMAGGSFSAGQVLLVGEGGRELVFTNGSGGGNVISNSNLRTASSSSPTATAPGIDLNSLASAVASLAQAVAGMAARPIDARFSIDGRSFARAATPSLLAHSAALSNGTDG